MTNGKFIISLDFELHWGAAEKWNLTNKKTYFDTTRKCIPQILSLFEKYEIHATWATVGFLFAKDKQQLLDFLPKHKPTYDNKILSYYRLIDNKEVGENESDDPYHYAPSLIAKILETPGQELATHTFSHYYCNEPGQTAFQFEADLQAAQSISKENFKTELQSLVFPRNQFNPQYTAIARKNGIKVIRTNPDVWFWKSDSKPMALARAADTLFAISGSLSFADKKAVPGEVLHLPASRFLRPYTEKEKIIRSLKLNRIKREMYFAAKNNRAYHLWWHPHNFGYSVQENIQDLEALLDHYKILNEKYGFLSQSMIETY